MNTVHWDKAQLRAVLAVDWSAPVDPLDHAEDRLHGAIDRTLRQEPSSKSEALVALGHAMGSLDQLVNFVDGIVDVSVLALIYVTNER